MNCIDVTGFDVVINKYEKLLIYSPRKTTKNQFKFHSLCSRHVNNFSPFSSISMFWLIWIILINYAALFLTINYHPRVFCRQNEEFSSFDEKNIKLTLAPTAHPSKAPFFNWNLKFYPRTSVFNVEKAGWGVCGEFLCETRIRGGGVTECLMEKQFSLFLHRDGNP